MPHKDYRWERKGVTCVQGSSKEKDRLKWCQAGFTLSQYGHKEPIRPRGKVLGITKHALQVNLTTHGIQHNYQNKT
ncbi:hypothetical protein H5410_057102 [Solanum commersonii]|uniref:Uncharacterized protein n=1 Tax=Solanum commersonii TaxID=4109 RepID=A0A9J5WPM8_SOLCO|nr:hypothetical protein H5410_057102 [Solanum commersonii]